MFDINTTDVKQLESDLKTFKARALPFATKATINRGAFETQKAARQNVRNDMVNRNKFSVQSIQVDQAKTLNIRQQEAAVGSIADYMEVQEFGGTKSKTVLPTSYSAGQGQNAQPRTRLPRKPNKLANIKLSGKGKRGKSKMQRNLIAIKQAAESGQKFVYLELRRVKGIFRVVGGKRRPKIKMVYNLDRKSVRVPATPWLAPAVEKIRPQMQKFYADALTFQLKRHNLF